MEANQFGRMQAVRSTSLLHSLVVQRNQRGQCSAALMLRHYAFKAGIEVAVEVLPPSVKVISMFRTEAGLKGLPCVSCEIDEWTDIRRGLRSVPTLLLQPGC